MKVLDWVNPKDKLPEYGSLVLIMTRWTPVVAFFYDSVWEGVESGRTFKMDEVLAWVPLDLDSFEPGDDLP